MFVACQYDCSMSDLLYFMLSQLLTDFMVIDGISTEVFIPTQLGSAVVASGLSPDEGLVVFGELQKARRCFVLENELHTVYLVKF